MHSLLYLKCTWKRQKKVTWERKNVCTLSLCVACFHPVIIGLLGKSLIQNYDSVLALMSTAISSNIVYKEDGDWFHFEIRVFKINAQHILLVNITFIVYMFKSSTVCNPCLFQFLALLTGHYLANISYISSDIFTMMDRWTNSSVILHYVRQALHSNIHIFILHIHLITSIKWMNRTYKSDTFTFFLNKDQNIAIIFCQNNLE